MSRTAAIPLLTTVITFLFVVGAAAQQDPEPSGWTVIKADQPNSCIASGPISGNTSLDIAIIGAEFKLLVSSSDFHFADGTYPLVVSIDGGPSVQLNSLAEANVYSVAITHDLGVAFRSASLLTAIVGGNTYNFHFAHADEAMDATSKCAGELSFAEYYAHPPADIPGADGWKVVDNIQGTKKCSIRKNSEQVDTTIIHRGDGGILLVAGRVDWAFPSSQKKITIQIDDGAPLDADGWVFDDLVFVPIADPKTQDQLKQAKRVLWHLPWGDFLADVDGMSVALDALESCDKRRAAASN
jgi:hypothetical protein